MKILLTGATGMVGQNFVELAKDSDFELLTPTSAQLNLLDQKSVNDWFKQNQPEAVVHAAGLVGGIQANIARPVDFLCLNTIMGINLINTARQQGVSRFLNLTSSCMYPRNVDAKLTEDLVLTGQLEPTNEGYALAKILTARLCDYINVEDSASNFKTLIPCNLYGRFDKFSIHNSHMIPAVIRKVDEAIKSSSKIVDIWGSGEARREFMFAGDLADFISFALLNFDRLPQNTNVGLGYDYAINEYYETIGNVLGFEGEFVHDLTKPEGMKRKLLDVSSIDSLGWKAKTDLKAGIAKTYEYYKSEYNEKQI